MRMHRLFVTVLAFCLVGLVPFTGSSSASADEPIAKATGVSADSPRQAKPARAVKFEFKQQRRTTYKFYGKIQAAQNKKFYLLRSNTKKGKYRISKTARTNSRGNYSLNNLRATGWFYIKVPSDSRFATSYSTLIHVFYQ